MRTTPKINKLAGIHLLDDTHKMRVISQFGTTQTPIRIDTQQVRAAARATMGVKLLDLDTDDKVADAMVISQRALVTAESDTLLQ